MAQNLRFIAQALGVCAILSACSHDGDPPAPSENKPPPAKDDEREQGDFISSVTQSEANSAGSLAADEAEDSASGAAVAAPASSEGAPARAIAEADIIQMDGDRLYALSRFSGLTLVDIEDPSKLQILGNHRIAAEPFEMYLEDDVVVAMFNGYGREVYDEEEDSYYWVETSRIQALDTSDPSQITVVGDFEVPGNISDSRLVGDVLYLATHEWGCWGCSSGPSTVVTSFNLENLQEIDQIDQLRFEEAEDAYIQQRSITVTPERIYIGGRDWDWTNEQAEGSTIQVVDISDPEGDLTEGAALQIAGYIDSRWQMDEHDGVLRVLSQWDEWRSDSPPKLETFRVESASEITKLAELPVELPRPEVLQSVRFDGDRAYAITFERTDPLFTFDLSNPEQPVQMGELEIPGWVYHMEPRGDRLYGIGFDNESEAGALHVSLFDVSDLSEPTMIERVNFGGQWGSFAEDQDRIHKSFRLLDEHGLIVLPFSGWVQSEDSLGCRGEYVSGVQLVDFTEDDLTLRGVAPQIGEARRAFVHREHLFGVGDDAVQSFDISDRDNVVAVDALETARNISAVRVLGDKVLRFGNDWWTDQTTLDLTTLTGADQPEGVSEVDLSQYIEETKGCYGWAYWGNVYVNGDYAYVERHSEDDESGKWTQRLTFYVVDISDIDNPKVLRTVDASPLAEDGELNAYSYFSGVVQTESALLVGRRTYVYTEAGDDVEQHFDYEVIDIRDGAKPVPTTVFEVPGTIAERGWGYFVGGCGVDMGWGWGGGSQSETTLVSGDIVASSHLELLEDDDTRGRYYLDRLDVSDPENPKMLEQVNIPGSLIHYDHQAGRALTLESDIENMDFSEMECWELLDSNPKADASWDEDGNLSCHLVKRSVHLLDVDGDKASLQNSVTVDTEKWTYGRMAVTADRVFVRQFAIDVIDEGDYSYWTEAGQRLRVFDAELEPLGALDVPAEASIWDDLRARGTRAFESTNGKLIVYDSTDPEQLTTSEKETVGWYCGDLEVRGDLAYCAQGKQGVSVIDLN